MHPLAMNALGFGSEYYWPLISNLFLGIGIIIAFGNRLVEGFAQPKAIALNILFCYVLAILLIQFMGFVPAIWFALFVYVIFWLEQWPLSKASQPAKGILCFVIIGFLSCSWNTALSLQVRTSSSQKQDCGLCYGCGGSWPSPGN